MIYEMRLKVKTNIKKIICKAIATIEILIIIQIYRETTQIIIETYYLTTRSWFSVTSLPNVERDVKFEPKLIKKKSSPLAGNKKPSQWTW